MGLDRDKHATYIDFGGCQPGLSNMRQSHESRGRDSPEGTREYTFSSDREKRKVVKGGVKSFGLPQLNDTSVSSQSCIVRHESPWDTFRPTMSCVIAGDVFIAAQRSNPSRVIAIRQYSPEFTQPMIELYRRLRHENILSARECFIEDNTLFALVDDLPLSLEHLVGCRSLFPTENELSSMLWQVSAGDYATRRRFAHVRRLSLVFATCATMDSNTKSFNVEIFSLVLMELSK